jgi:hypothetical protein
MRFIATQETSAKILCESRNARPVNLAASPRRKANREIPMKMNNFVRVIMALPGIQWVCG